MATDLDYAQTLKGAYQESSQALRTGAPIALEINIQPGASTGAIVASVLACPGTRNLNLVALVGASGLSGAASASLEYSPSDDDAVWLSTSVSLASTTAVASTTSGTQQTNLLARRIRLVLGSAPTGGDVTYYVIGS